MSTQAKMLMAIYLALSTPLTLLGFAGLLSRRMGFRIPFVSTEIIPALHRHAVWGETLKGRAIMIGGEDWFFLIVIGIVIMLAIVMAILHMLIKAVVPPPGKKGPHAR